MSELPRAGGRRRAARAPRRRGGGAGRKTEGESPCVRTSRCFSRRLLMSALLHVLSHPHPRTPPSPQPTRAAREHSARESNASSLSLPQRPVENHVQHPPRRVPVRHTREACVLHQRRRGLEHRMEEVPGGSGWWVVSGVANGRRGERQPAVAIPVGVRGGLVVVGRRGRPPEGAVATPPRLRSNGPARNDGVRQAKPQGQAHRASGSSSIHPRSSGCGWVSPWHQAIDKWE